MVHYYPSTRNNCLIHHTRRLQEIHDPGSGPQGPLKFSLRQFVRRRVSNGRGEGDLEENGHGGGGECCEEGEATMARGGNTSPSSAFLAFRGPNACQSDQAGTQAQAINSCAGLSIRYTLWSTPTTDVGSVAAILSSISTHRSCTISSLQASSMNDSPWEIPHEPTLKEKSSCRSASWLVLRGVLRCSPPAVAERQKGRLAKRSLSHFVPRRGSALGEQTIPARGGLALGG